MVPARDLPEEQQIRALLHVSDSFGCDSQMLLHHEREGESIGRWYRSIPWHQNQHRRSGALSMPCPDFLWTALPDGTIDFLKQRWCACTGLSLEESHGWGWQAAIYSEDLPGRSRRSA